MAAKRYSLVILGFAVACGSSSDTTTVDVRMRAHASPAAGGGLAVEEDGDSPVEISVAEARVRDIEFYIHGGVDCDGVQDALDDDVDCEDDEKLVIEGPFEIDLIAGTAEPSLDEIALPEDVYDRVDVRVKDDDGDPAFVAEGEVDGEEFSIALEFSEDARFEDDDGVELAPDVEAIVLSLDADQWLDGVPLANCVENGDIDEDDDCSDIENQIKDNVEDSGRLLLE